jgi:hypothetical protein
MEPVCPDLSAAAVVLFACCRAEVCLSIIKAVMIYVVNEYMMRDFEDLAVHLDDEPFPAILQAGCPHGIESATACGDVPFVFV